MNEIICAIYDSLSGSKEYKSSFFKISDQWQKVDCITKVSSNVKYTIFLNNQLIIIKNGYDIRDEISIIDPLCIERVKAIFHESQNTTASD
jgi:hypothetical protein